MSMKKQLRQKKEEREGVTSEAKKTPRKAKKTPSGRAQLRGGKRVKRVIVAICLLGMICFLGLNLDIRTVSSNAMMPTLAKGDIVLVWAPAWFSFGAEVGDVVEIEEESAGAPNFLRVMATENARIAFQDDVLRVDGQKLDRLLLTNTSILHPKEEPEIWRETANNGKTYRIMIPQQALVGSLSGEGVVKDGVFCVGDNRMASYDSRQRGVFTRDRIRGRMLIVLESVRDDAVLGRWLKWPD